MDFKGSKTEANLQAAFAGESQARNKYSYFASQAKKDGLNYIADIFEETAHNEMAHAKIWFKLLQNDGDPKGGMPDTLHNLAAAAAGEQFEWTEMYKEFAETAREEGFDTIACLMDGVAKIEKHHEDRYRTLINDIENDETFKQPVAVIWRCANCGHLHAAMEAPELCPVCHHPKAYFEMTTRNY